MKYTKAPARYAKALLDLSIEINRLDEVEADIKRIDNIIKQEKSLAVLLKSPVVSADRKMKVFSALFGNKLGETSSKFISLIAAKGRENLLHDICVEFIRQVKVYRNILVVEVESASPLMEEARNRIMGMIREIHEGGLELVEKIDTDLIGGFILKVGDHRVDASVEGKIRHLRQMFDKNPYEVKF